MAVDSPLPPSPDSLVDHALIRVNGQWVYVITGSDLLSDAKIIMRPPPVRVEFRNGKQIDDSRRAKRPQTFVPPPCP